MGEMPPATATETPVVSVEADVDVTTPDTATEGCAEATIGGDPALDVGLDAAGR